MEAQSPVLSEEFAPVEIVYAKDQPGEEREAVASGSDILLSIVSFNGPISPFRIEVAEHPRSIVEIAEEFRLIP